MGIPSPKSTGGILVAGIALLLAGAAVPSAAATFTVNSTADAPDANPSDGVCADIEGRCTLRAAIMQANALGGSNTIDLTQINDPNNPIILSIPGADETAEGNPGTGYIAVSAHDASKGDLNVTSSMDLIGAGADRTIIEWDPSVKESPGAGDRVFHIEAVSASIAVTLSGVTIRDGITPQPVILQTLADGTYYQLERWGAGIAIGPAASVALVNPALSGSDNGSGGDEGGMGGPGGNGGGEEGEEGEEGATITGVTLTDVRILDNQSGAAGGGISNAAPLILDDVLVSGNSAATNGGGIYNDAQLTVTDSTIGLTAGFPNGNSAEGGGGLFDTGMHTSTIDGSAIIGNKAVGGGGISARAMVTLNITNSTLDANQATDVGAGITSNGPVNLKNDTIADNASGSDSPSGGAGVNVFGKGVFSYVNTLFQGNVAVGSGFMANCGCSGSSCRTGVLVSQGHNLADDNTCALSGSGDLMNTIAQLLPLAQNGGRTETRALQSGSPAVDAGDNDRCPNTDQRGSLRPADGSLRNSQVCDIGAFELFVDRADVHVSGKKGPDRVARGAPLNATVQFTNDQGATADAAGVVITTDPLPEAFALSRAAVTTQAGTVECALDASTRVVTCEVGTLPKGQTATLELQGTATAAGRLKITAHIAAVAPVDLFPDNNSTTLDVLVQGVSNVGVSASGPGQQPRVQGSAGLKFTVSNLGPDPATGVRVLAIFRNRMRYRAMQVASGGTCTLLDDGLSAVCDCGTVAAGNTVTGTLDLLPTSAGTADVEFQVATDSVDSDNTNDSIVVPLTIADEPAPVSPSSSAGGGGCVWKPGGPFDPAIPSLLALGALGFIARRRKAGKRNMR